MADLNSIVVFAKVVEAMSFSEAARRLKMPISSVSRHVSDLERRLGIRLLERSTRRLRLTELGAEIFEYAKRSVELSDAIENLVSNRLAEVAGVLRLSAPPEHHFHKLSFADELWLNLDWRFRTNDLSLVPSQ